MKNIKKVLTILFAVSFFIPVLASAHQPRIPDGAVTNVSEPEISKAYYGQLAGEPQAYEFSSDKNFELYVNILVPDIVGQKKDVSFAVFKNGSPLATLNGINAEWKKLFEPFGHDTYWQGPEYKAQAGPGQYEIKVWSSNNDSKYSLAIGETEAFGIKDGWNAIRLIPELKKNFFNVSPADFIFSPFGWGFIVISFAAAFIIGFIVWIIFRISGKRTGISGRGRIIRLILAIALTVLAIFTTWNPVLLLVAGYLIFEAIFSRCAPTALVLKH